MTLGMFIFLLIWIAVCTAKPEKTYLDVIEGKNAGETKGKW